MKKTHLIGLIVAVVALLGAFLILRDRQGPSTSLPADADVLGGSIQNSEIAVIRLARKGTEGVSELILRKKGEEWLVESGDTVAPADPNWIDQLFESFAELDKGGEPRGSSAAVHAAFQIGEDTGTRLELRNASGETLQDLMIGKSSADWSGTFVRRANEETVYLVRTALRQRLRLRGTQEEARIDPAAWWRLRLFAVDLADLVRVDVSGQAAIARVVALQPPEETTASDGEGAEEPETPPAPSEPEWKLVAGEELGDPKGLARSFATARAQSVAPPEADTGLDAGSVPAASMRGRTVDGRDLLLEFGSEVPDNEGARYVRRGGEDVVYVLPSYAVRNLLRAGEE